MASHAVDVVVVGASFGGVAAALAAAQDPKVHVALLEPSQWIGGQATAQGVTRWDEEQVTLIETVGSTKAYRSLRDAIRTYYKSSATLSAAGKAQAHFNPGYSANDLPFSVDPSVTQHVLKSIVASNPRVNLQLGTPVTAVSVSGTSVTSVTTKNGDTYTAKVYLDATDLGDLLPLAKLPFKIGAEAQSDTKEPAAPAQAQPHWIQPVTVPIALELRPAGESHIVAKPANYDDIARSQKFHIVDGDINGVIHPKPGGAESIWSYRQYIDPVNFSDPSFAHSRTTLNVGSNDYQAATVPTGTAAGDAAVYAGARDASIAFVYWLQTEVERDDGNGNGYPNLKIRTDAFGTADGCAPQAYIRESRRIDALERVVQQDIDKHILPPGSARARNFPSSCGIGIYGVDVHAASGPGTPWTAVDTLPFQIPLGALLPKQLDNFVASCKNIGATHLTSGAYRVHPVEWAIGEAAGVLAAFCVTQGIGPKDVFDDAARQVTYQYRLLARGVPLFWWSDVRFEDDAKLYAAVHFCGVKGAFTGESAETFAPNDPAGQAVRNAVDDNLGTSLPWPSTAMTRGQTAVFVCEQMHWPIGE